MSPGWLWHRALIHVRLLFLGLRLGDLPADGTCHVGGGGAAAQVAGVQGRIGSDLLNRRHQRLRRRGLAQMLQHHHGRPESAHRVEVPHDLTRHNCIGIRQGDEAYGIWRLRTGKRTETVKVRGNLSTNDGEIAVNWALDGHGILMRAEWDIAKYLRSGRLQPVLENYRTPPADIHAVYPQRHQLSARVRAFVDFLANHFEKSSTRAAGLVTNW